MTSTETTNGLLQFYRLSCILTILIFVNILFGPLVRATNSGLACPDWPLCYGKVIPPPDFRQWMEVGHRFYSGIISVFLIYLAFLTLKNPIFKKRFGGYILAAIFIIFIQIILGRLTVTELLNPKTVNLHLLNAVLLLATVGAMTLKAKFFIENGSEKNSIIKIGKLLDTKTFFLLITLLFVFLQLYMGGKVSSNYAGLACPDFPTCNGEWFPEMNGLVRFQMEHRFGAYITVFLVFSSFVISIVKSFDQRTRLFLKAAFHTVSLQIVIGIFNVLFKLPVLLTALHSGIGVLLFLLVFAGLYQKLIFESEN